MTQQLTRTEFCTIVEPIEAVPGKYGPQYKFKASVPWTQYPPTFYVNQNLMPKADTPENREALLNTDHWVSFKRGNLMKNEDGSTKDAELDWNYRWDVIGWDVPAETATSGGSSGGGGSDRNRSIERQVAFKGAIDLVLGQAIELADVTYYTDIFAQAIADDYITSEELAADREPAAPGHLVETAKAYGAVEIPEDESPSAPPPCTIAGHNGAAFEYKKGRTGVSKWTHKKEDNTWCIFDGEVPAEAAISEPDF